MSWGFTGRRRWRHASDLQVTGWQVCGRNDIFLDQWIPWAKVLQGRQGLWLLFCLPGVDGTHHAFLRPKMAFSLMLPAAELIVQAHKFWQSS